MYMRRIISEASHSASVVRDNEAVVKLPLVVFNVRLIFFYFLSSAPYGFVKRALLFAEKIAQLVEGKRRIV